MADPEEIVEELRTEEGYGSERDPTYCSNAKRKWSRKRRNSGGSRRSAQTGQVTEGTWKENGNGGRSVRPQVDNQKQDTPPAGQEDHRTKFYEHYHTVAEEYDKEFLKKYNEDLNTTLIFAGLFSAVASAFIIEVDSQLQPDSGDETVALLRILIYKFDNTTFGGNVPTLPQWTGPPRAMVHVQAILFASIAASLFSAFLAMLGKQWLNRYESTDMQGSAIERSQNRQRKLDGIITWYFDNVIGSLPLVLQTALLLLSCALSRYLWGIDTTVASVVLGITSFCVIIFLFIIIAGAAIESCPYQTPGSRFLRYLGPKCWKVIFSVPTVVVSALGITFRETAQTIRVNTRAYYPWWSRSNIMRFSRDLISEFPLAFATDAWRLCQAAARTSAVPPTRVYHFCRGLHSRLRGTSPTRQQRSNWQTTALDLRCISWTLQTSLDKAVHTSAMLYLMLVLKFVEFDSTLVQDCFNIFLGSISISNQRVAIIQGTEQLTTVSARCFYRTFHRLTVRDPTSGVLRDIRRRYHKVFPVEIDFAGLPSRHTMIMIHAFVTGDWSHYHVWCDGDEPPNHEHIQFARDIVEVAQVEYQREQGLPDWILWFVFRSLTLDPLPPASAVADCLKIIAIDLGCEVSNIQTLDESVDVEEVSSLITQKLENMIEAGDRVPIIPKHLAICVLLPYAIFLGKGGRREMVNSIFRAAKVSGTCWFIDPVGSYITMLLGKPSSPFLDWLITLASPQIDWESNVDEGYTVVRWAAAALAVPDAEEVSQSVVDTLLQISSIESLRPHIPIKIWAWLKKRPSLPPVCLGRRWGTTPDTVRHVRGLRDPEILKSYFLLVWSEWDELSVDGLDEMGIVISEEFGGIGMWNHREDLIKRLDDVLERLDLGLEYLEQHNPRVKQHHIEAAQGQYGRLKEVLLRVDREAVNVLAQSRCTFICALPLPCL